MQGSNVFGRYLSPRRLASYSAHGADAVALYKWNIELSEALYPLLNTVEVSLRNSLHSIIAEHIYDKNWLLNKNSKIMQKLHWHWISKLDANINEMLVKQRLDEDHLVADLPFGFWTTLLGNQFEYKQFLWPTLKNRAFPFAHGVKINTIRDTFSQVRCLRNRVFHYEAIWHWKNLQHRHDEIITAIKWINPTLLDLVERHRFQKIYSKKSVIFEQRQISKLAAQEAELI